MAIGLLFASLFVVRLLVLFLGQINKKREGVLHDEKE